MTTKNGLSVATLVTSAKLYELMQRVFSDENNQPELPVRLYTVDSVLNRGFQGETLFIIIADNMARQMIDKLLAVIRESAGVEAQIAVRSLRELPRDLIEYLRYKRVEDILLLPGECVGQVRTSVDQVIKKKLN